MTLEDLLKYCEEIGLDFFIEPATEEEAIIENVTKGYDFPAFGIINTWLYAVYKIEDVYLYGKLGFEDMGTSTNRILKKFNEAYKRFLE